MSYTWTAYGTLGGIIRRTHFRDSKHGWMCGSQGSLFRTSDGGSTWTTIPFAIVNDAYGDFTSVFSLSGSFTVACCVNGWTYKTIDDGSNWYLKKASIDRLQDIHFSDESNGVAVGDNYCRYTTDGGVSWGTTNNMPTNRVYKVRYFGTGTYYAGGDQGANWGLIRSTDFGHTWAAVGSRNIQSNLLRVFDVFGLGTTIWAAHDAGVSIWDSTGSWHNFFTGAGAQFNVYFFDQLNGVAIGQQGTVRWSTNGGTSWGFDSKLLDKGYSSLDRNEVLTGALSAYILNSTYIFGPGTTGKTYQSALDTSGNPIPTILISGYGYIGGNKFGGSLAKMDVYKFACWNQYFNRNEIIALSNYYQMLR